MGGEPVAMLNTVYFDYDKSNLRPDQLRTLESNLAWIRQNPGSRIRLEGHCDERGTEEYNLALGDNRADAVRNWLTAQGVGPGNVGGISKGELEPVELGHDESAWAKNRRVEFLILE
jgi:peptidoglycan-associated lipoprotein